MFTLLRTHNEPAWHLVSTLGEPFAAALVGPMPKPAPRHLCVLLLPAFAALFSSAVAAEPSTVDQAADRAWRKVQATASFYESPAVIASMLDSSTFGPYTFHTTFSVCPPRETKEEVKGEATDETRHLFDLASLHVTDRVLDFGCGVGGTAMRLAASGRVARGGIVGANPSREQLVQATAEARRRRMSIHGGVRLQLLEGSGAGGATEGGADNRGAGGITLAARGVGRRSAPVACPVLGDTTDTIDEVDDNATAAADDADDDDDDEAVLPIATGERDGEWARTSIPAAPAAPAAILRVVAALVAPLRPYRSHHIRVSPSSLMSKTADTDADAEADAAAVEEEEGNEEGDDGDGEEKKVGEKDVREHSVTESPESPLKDVLKVHVYHLWTKEICTYLVAEIDKYAQYPQQHTQAAAAARKRGGDGGEGGGGTREETREGDGGDGGGGWTRNRHGRFPTTDIPLKDTPLWSFVEAQVRQVVFPTMARDIHGLVRVDSPRSNTKNINSTTTTTTTTTTSSSSSSGGGNNINYTAADERSKRLNDMLNGLPNTAAAEREFASRMRIRDVFFVKYDSDAQAELPVHRYGSLLSFR